MAIMGPSGCGKTTLLDVLAHRESSAKARVSSTILINNQRPSLPDVRRLSSYVECDDTLIGSLTVKETLYFTARLSLSGSRTAAERTRRVNELLQAFGLTDESEAADDPRSRRLRLFSFRGPGPLTIRAIHPGPC